MPRIAAVDPSQIHRAFLDAFADYAMDASGTTEEALLLRMRKNAVDFDASPGLYDGDRLVGFTLIGVDLWGGLLTAYDAGTGIVPEFRKQGWAKTMFDHALPTLRGRGVRRFLLGVLQGNEPAIKAYRKSGFEISRELRCFLCQTETLRAAGKVEIQVLPIDRETFASHQASADWVPSFENRFTAVDAIPEDVRLAGAFEGGECVGVTAYVPGLNWLLTIAVDREQRRHGIGAALLHRLVDSLPESISRLAALNVDAGDTGTQAFFESLGFSHLVDQYEMIREI